MIITTDKKPDFSLFNIGGMILEVLNRYGDMNFDQILEEVLQKLDAKISINYIYFSLDWLYLISLIDIKNGKITLCK